MQAAERLNSCFRDLVLEPCQSGIVGVCLLESGPAVWKGRR